MNDDARPAPEPQDIPPHSDEAVRQDPSRRSVLWTTAGVAGRRTRPRRTGSGDRLGGRGDRPLDRGGGRRRPRPAGPHHG